jgi:hypothetical protein
MLQVEFSSDMGLYKALCEHQSAKSDSNDELREQEVSPSDLLEILRKGNNEQGTNGIAWYFFLGESEANVMALQVDIQNLDTSDSWTFEYRFSRMKQSGLTEIPQITEVL